MQVTGLSIANGAIWQINREIEFTFDRDVDFSTVSLNTISIRTPSGTPASGTFFFRQLDTDFDGLPDTDDPRTVVFQPRCPTLDDLSDAGLKPGGVAYEVIVVGQSSGASQTVRSRGGRPVTTTQRRTFTTPASVDPQNAFLDNVIGAPIPIIRLAGSERRAATYIEVGGDDDSRVYIEFDGSGNNPQVPGFTVPLNLYSDGASSVAVVIEFNQPVSPRAANINASRVRLEFLSGGVWRPLDTRVELIANCTAAGGATVRLEPIGILPEGSMFRAVVRDGFQDISASDAVPSPIVNFLEVPTAGVTFASLTPANGQGDELLEEFLVGGTNLDSFEDQAILFDTARASWGGGNLRAGFDFQGTGGPGGNFDVVVRENQVVFFDTTSQSISGGPGGIPTATQTAVNGVLDVRDLIIEEGGTLRILGPNQFTLNASGRVVVRGTLDASGFPSKDVVTLNTGHQPEVGGNGVAGGGRGGGASSVTNASTPKGSDGFGAFQVPSAGGRGGESGFTGQNQVDARRPGGGGGGAFGPTVTVTNAAPNPDVEVVLIAEAGRIGAANTTGAVSGLRPAPGGAAALGPFVDANLNNDHFGVRPLIDYTTNGENDPILLGLETGELFRIWAGGGGGGGGDAIPSSTFPNEPWDIGSDEKGGGGGGGGGAVHIRSLGPIVFGSEGRISADGGTGANGENTNFLDHIGGSGGGGSGGHVVIETASFVDFTDGGKNDTLSPPFISLSARGAVGGDGTGANQISRGGKGGPGIVQIHVPDPLSAPTAFNVPEPADVRVPLDATVGVGYETTDLVSWPPPTPMIPTFGARSKAQSRWISLGGADQIPGGVTEFVRFFFDGIENTVPEDDPAHGNVLATAGKVDDLPPLLGPEDVGTATVEVLPGGTQMRISGASLTGLIMDASVPSKDIYLRTPALLKNFNLRLTQIGGLGVTQDFVVTAASYDDAGIALLLTVNVAQGTLSEFISNLSGTKQYSLHPRFLRLNTGGALDALPANAEVKILFQATGADSFGQPVLPPLIDWTANVAKFHEGDAMVTVNPGDVQFFRFQVEFNLDTTGSGLTVDTDPINLDFLRIPFRFGQQ